ncbi:hypothetical protein DDB_G0288881 [Dictyostelium discoideum AX4]|uniref:60S ribosomal export protein NMD3 SH3 domain-containing protein n=1 Tax=Dictyostelium discoideum TaxID=44689 RepID=Q54IB3_DICDI|nr:hypothetical protein DDB_G0288881 [Dictyostelium discoideum AX4]EAL62964.1 hypothetical protein DDB_G0288881 [Dictyostelium discoideum AX4]|eukprot:XP_636466.1 hypothetical protein DDB_G0288881 [Dictyostelium discoideum AX4]
MGPLVVVTKVSNLIHFMDPNTLQTGEISALTFGIPHSEHYLHTNN